MALFDTEDLIKKVRDVYKANLNAEIAIIDTEKADFTTPAISTDAWFLQNLPEGVYNYSEFVVYGLEKVDYDEPQLDNNIKNVTIFIEVVITDDGTDDAENAFWKHMRYIRALQQVAFKNFDKYRGIAKVKVDELEPTGFSLDGKIFRTAGIKISGIMSAR